MSLHRSRGTGALDYDNNLSGGGPWAVPPTSFSLCEPHAQSPDLLLSGVKHFVFMEVELIGQQKAKDNEESSAECAGITPRRAWKYHSGGRGGEILLPGTKSIQTSSAPRRSLPEHGPRPQEPRPQEWGQAHTAWVSLRHCSLARSCAPQVLGSTPGLYPQDASSTPSCDNPKCLQTLPNVPLRTQSLSLQPISRVRNGLWVFSTNPKSTLFTQAGEERCLGLGGSSARDTKTKSDKCPAMYIVQQLTANLSNIPGNFADVRALAAAEAPWQVHGSGATQQLLH